MPTSADDMGGLVGVRSQRAVVAPLPPPLRPWARGHTRVPVVALVWEAPGRPLASEGSRPRGVRRGAIGSSTHPSGTNAPPPFCYSPGCLGHAAHHDAEVFIPTRCTTQVRKRDGRGKLARWVGFGSLRKRGHLAVGDQPSVT